LPKRRNMSNSKRMAIILISFVMCIAVGFLSVQLYFYYNPELDIHISSSTKEDMDIPMIAYNQRSIFGISEKAEREIMDAGNELREVLEDVKLKMEVPRSLKAEIESDKRQTILTMSGYGTKNGKKEDINKQIVINLKATEIVRETP